MKTARLIFGSTNSQPVGTTDEEIEHVYQTSYKPYLRALYNAPQVPVALHYSGQLLQWLEKHHSEYTDVLSEMVARKQCEILGGGFYDPVLSLIPRLDRLGQIESLTTYVRKRFGRRPRGTWITEHVWEPSLASTLRSSGMEYVFLDDYHFVAAGMHGDDLCRPCITEDQGKTVVVFPVCHDLRLISRSKQPEDVIAFLEARADTDDSRVYVLMDYGGRAPYVSAGSDGGGVHSEWLERFVELIQQNREWLEVGLPSAFAREPRMRSRAYFHSSGSEAMLYWSLSPTQQNAYTSSRDRAATGKNGYQPAGHFRQFLARYAESNQMYAKMQYTHVLVNQIRGDKYRKQAAREELWKGQCHNAYWHGHHGGIYQNRLRKQVYRSLIDAEKKTRERGIFIPSIVTVDFDMDGVEEFLYQGTDLNAYVHEVGGMLFELDYLPTSWNYLDTLTRRPERYHSADDEALGYDAYPRRAFVDHFLPIGASLDDFAAGRVPELGSFVNGSYRRLDGKRDPQRLDLVSTGVVSQPKGRTRQVEITKAFGFKRGLVEVDYSVSCIGDARLEAVFAPEINLAFLSEEVDALRLFVKGGRGQAREIGPSDTDLEAVCEVRLEDLANHTAVIVSFSSELAVWCFPVRTVRRSASTVDGETEGERFVEYQSTCVVPRIPLSLDPGAKLQTTLRIRFEKL